MLRLNSKSIAGEVGRKSNKMLGRIYITLGIGLTARLLGIRPSKFSLGGIEMTLDNTNVIPGFFFLITIALTMWLLVYMISHSFHINANNSAMLRVFVYRASGTKRTIRGRIITIFTLKDKNPLVVKMVAKLFFRIYISILTLVMFFPLLFVITFERHAIVDALSRLLIK